MITINVPLVNASHSKERISFPVRATTTATIVSQSAEPSPAQRVRLKVPDAASSKDTASRVAAMSAVMGKEKGVPTSSQRVVLVRADQHLVYDSGGKQQVVSLNLGTHVDRTG